MQKDFVLRSLTEQKLDYSKKTSLRMQTAHRQNSHPV